MACTRVANILFPKKGTDLAKWAVVACDQYTSEPKYWEEVETIVGDAPSTLRITLPEVYLEEDGVDERIENINTCMKQYLEKGILEELPKGMMLLERETGQVCSRKGIVMAFDLEAYDYKPGAVSLIRPTEKTVEERIPPRLKVRLGASVEVPHIMLLIDDPQRTIIEPLFEQMEQFECKYDVELMQNGGHLKGWFIPKGDVTDKIQEGLEKLADREAFRKKYRLEKDYPIVQFATGDGNHSMATAKAYWEQVKKNLTEEEQKDHPARFVLAEIVNIHDESLLIEAIYRVLFDVDPKHVLNAAKSFFEKNGATVTEGEVNEEGVQVFPWYAAETEGVFSVKNSKWSLPVASLQAFLDAYLKENPGAKIDYIHGLDTVKTLSAQKGNMGFYLPDPAKGDLFRGVIMDGVLPRKTFSMGSANEKRYYMEAKCIVK
ncbi:MAG: DUF1015 domain-containing protein [Eubacteriales bacterium]|nr:DUF1015 domain-containing protein [Eubacteriales bacterium]